MNARTISSLRMGLLECFGEIVAKSQGKTKNPETPHRGSTEKSIAAGATPRLLTRKEIGDEIVDYMAVLCAVRPGDPYGLSAAIDDHGICHRSMSNRAETCLPRVVESKRRVTGCPQCGFLRWLPFPAAIGLV